MLGGSRSCLVLLLAPFGLEGTFAPGWNGRAQLPPLGWRSWNAFNSDITQDMMMQAVEALIAKNRTLGARGNVSLCDLGFCEVGVDDGWESCARDSKGRPLPDSSRFPDLAALVAFAHRKGVKIGWYLNGCKCNERDATTKTYAGDVAALSAYQFDSVKIDDCSAHHNFTEYAELMRASGRNFTVEVHNPGAGACQNGDKSTCPTLNWCPFNFYRTSHDIKSSPQSWFRNLQTTVAFQAWDAPLSRPGCWAYPDMLEVGRVLEPAPGAWFSWNRAHFGAWCVTSSPLILGLELANSVLQPVLEVIGNAEAISVNQQWAGHPGFLVSNRTTGAGAAESGMVQLWMKPLPHGAVAALVINNSPDAAKFDIDFQALKITEHIAAVRDIWNQDDLGPFQNRVPLQIARYDSSFLKISPHAPLQVVV